MVKVYSVIATIVAGMTLECISKHQSGCSMSSKGSANSTDADAEMIEWL